MRIKGARKIKFFKKDSSFEKGKDDKKIMRAAEGY